MDTVPPRNGDYSIAKAQAKSVAAGAGAFGLLWVAQWLAQILLPVLEEYAAYVPPELLTMSGLAAFIVYVYTLVKDRLVMLGYWPKILG